MFVLDPSIMIDDKVFEADLGGIFYGAACGSKQGKILTIIGLSVQLSAISSSEKLDSNCAICAIIMQFSSQYKTTPPLFAHLSLAI